MHVAHETVLQVTHRSPNCVQEVCEWMVVARRRMRVSCKRQVVRFFIRMYEISLFI